MTRLFLALMTAASAVSVQAQSTAAAVVIQPSVDTPKQRQELRSFMTCVAKSRPTWAREMLAKPYLSEAQTEAASDALSGRDRCLMKPEAEMTFRTSSIVSIVAEHSMHAALTDANIDPLSKALNTLTPLNASEDFALCVASRDPVAARELSLSEPGGAAETLAAGKLAVHIQPCVIKGEQPTVDLQSLRGLMSIALYRAVTTARLASN